MPGPIASSTGGAPEGRPDDRRAVIAVAVQFFMNGAVFASFVPRFPEIRDHVGLSLDEIGLVLSLSAAIALAGSALAGPVIGRLGTRRTLVGAGLVVAGALVVIGAAGTTTVLFLGLAMATTCDVLVDSAMNMQASVLSARRGVSIMNRFHGLWSLGTVVGGIISSRVADAGVSLRTHLVTAAVVQVGALAFVSAGLLPNDDTPPRTGPDQRGSRGGPHRRLIGLTTLYFAAVFAIGVEMVAIDWSSFRLREDFDTSAGTAALAYVAVTAGMTAGRLLGDWATVALGAERLARISVAVTAGGLAVATLAPDRVIVIAAFALIGLGIATWLPRLYDLAAQRPGRPGAGLGALTAGLRSAALALPWVVGSLAGFWDSVGRAMAAVSLPSVVGFGLLAVAARRRTLRG